MHTTPRRFAALAALAAVALAVSACAPETTPTPTPTEAPPTTGIPNPNATLNVGLVLEPENLDIRRTGGAALEQVLIGNIYEGLVHRTDDNQVVPRLAENYTVSPDALVYTFTLREGVTFHNGDPLTLADALSSLGAVHTDASLQGHGDLAGVAEIIGLGDRDIQITLTEPDQNFLWNLTGRAGLIFQDGDETDLKTAANGTGPFTLVRWSQGSSITFARNDAYWGEKAGVAQVVLHYIDDFTAGVNAALDGTLDVLTAVQGDLAPQLEASGDFTLTQGRTTDTATLAFNNNHPVLRDVRVREALRLAINKEALVAALGGGGETLYGPIPAIDPGYEDLSEFSPYDPERAEVLLAEAGHEDLELTLTIPAFYGTTVPRVLVSDLAKVGVTLAVDSVEFGTWFEKVYVEKNYDLSFVLHVEARDFDNYANPGYYFGYNNTQVQRLYAQAMATVDADAAAELLAEAARIVSSEHAADWLYNGVTITAHRGDVQGFPQDSINSRLDLAGVVVLSR